MAHFSTEGGFCEFIIRDSTGAKLETFKWALDNKTLEKKIFSIVRSKYGIFEVKREDKDLSWAKE